MGHLTTSQPIFEGMDFASAEDRAKRKYNSKEIIARVIRRVLGTVNYLTKFLPHLSQVSKPL